MLKIHPMKASLLVKLMLAVYVFLVLLSCKKKSIETSGSFPTSTPPSGSDTGVYYAAKTVCNYDDLAFTSSGWTKIFEDNFDSGLSNWTVWTGGSASRELQYYKESNLVVANGVLQIITKKETVANKDNVNTTSASSGDYISFTTDGKLVLRILSFDDNSTYSILPNNKILLYGADAFDIKTLSATQLILYRKDVISAEDYYEETYTFQR